MFSSTSEIISIHINMPENAHHIFQLHWGVYMPKQVDKMLRQKKTWLLFPESSQIKLYKDILIKTLSIAVFFVNALLCLSQHRQYNIHSITVQT